MNQFEQFGLKEELVAAINAIGFKIPSPIQEKTIPLLVRENTDITALAQTGTGKTAAFGLPLLNRIDVSSRTIQALILSPTRELCMQTKEEMVKYSQFLKGAGIVAVYGGAPIGAQIREIKYGPQIIVATPGRLMDLMDKGVIQLDDVKTVVLDEADEMLNMGFREDIELILKNAEAKEACWLFSATMNNDVRRIAKRFMKNITEVAVAAENITNENIDHQYFVTNAHQRYETLKRLLDFAPDIYGIIFTRTKIDAQEISEKLMREGYHVAPLHGDMDQKMRTKVMDRFKKGNLQAIIATDVAARGIDVNDITHVINYELPDDVEIYTHRSGRTARAGKSGICMSIITPREIGKLRAVERIAKTKFTKTDIPDGNEVVRKRLFYFMEKLEKVEGQVHFSDTIKNAISERFDNIDKDELIQRLLWLQLKDTIENYENAHDLNSGFADKSSGSSSSDRSGSVRIFMNLGTKDGLNPQKLLQFITDETDLDQKLINRITIRELSSFFNVPADAVDFIMTNINSRKYNGRKVRVEEADNKPSFQKDNNFDRNKPYGRGSGSGGSGGSSSSYGKRSGSKPKGSFGDEKKGQRARKPLA
ncbi:MAG TPA: DEAD/DEAH box helicase [Edaphocola sp.]|nr:DEAD/DEAH box helicase [Edaphocola sp.]